MTVNFAPEQTGIAAYTTSLARGLAKHGHRVSVLTAAPHYPAWKTAPDTEWAADEVVEGVAVTRLKSFVPSKPNLVSRTVFELLYGVRFLAKLRSDSDVVVLVSPALFASALARLGVALGGRRQRTLLWIQDRYSAGVQEMSGGFARAAGGAIRVIEAALARSCDGVVVIHDRWTPEVVRAFGLDPSRVHTIRNWTHVRPPHSVDVAATRRSLGWDESDIVVLHSGNMGAKQGLENVIEAARFAVRRGLPVRFVLLGDGNQRSRLQELGSDCRALQFIAPLPQDEFLAAMTAADVLLVNELPGLQETAVPSKLTSYFATGRPVLAATDETSVTADEVRASGAGVVIPAGDPEVLTHVAMRLHSQRHAHDPKAGPAFVHRHLSEQAGIDAFATLLREVTLSARNPEAHNAQIPHEERSRR